MTRPWNAIRSVLLFTSLPHPFIISSSLICLSTILANSSPLTYSAIPLGTSHASHPLFRRSQMGNGFARTAKTTLGHLWELGNRRSRRRGNRGGASGLRLLPMRGIRKVRLRLVDLVDDFRLTVWFSQRPKRRGHDSDFDQWEILYSSMSWTVPVSLLFNRHDLFRLFHVLALLVIYCLCRPILTRLILIVTMYLVLTTPQLISYTILFHRCCYTTRRTL